MLYLERWLIAFSQSRIGELFRYGIAGSIAVLVHLLVLAVLVEVWAVNETLASAIGFICATPVNYILQKKYVFNSSAKLITSFSIYCIITISTLMLNTILFWTLSTVTNWHYVSVQVITITIIFILNYYLNRNITFSNR